MLRFYFKIKCFQSKYLAISLLLSVSTIYFNQNISYGESPAFIRQEIDDSIGDIYDTNVSKLNDKEISECERIQFSYYPSLDIKGVSYESNGKILNSTLWLDQPFHSFNNFTLHKFYESIDSAIDRSFAFRIGILNSLNYSTFSDYIKNFITELNSSGVVNLEQLTPITKDNNKGYRITLNLKDDPSKIILVFIEKNSIVYTQTFVIPDYLYLPLIQKIIDSTKFIQYNETSLVTYENPSYGIKFQYPANLISENYIINANYELTKNKSETEIFNIFKHKDPERLSFKLLAKSNIKNFTLEDLQQESIRLFNEDSDFVITKNESKQYNLSSESVITENFYTFQDENNSSKYFKAMSTFLNDTDNIYLFTYKANETAFLEHLPLIQKIIDSTKFIQYNETSLVTYENPSYGIKFQYPINSEIMNKDLQFFKKNFNDIRSDSNNLQLDPILQYSGEPIGNSYILPVTDVILDKVEISKKEVPDEDKNERFAIYYFMLIDVISIYDKGVDYAIQIQWNKTSSNWDRLFVELSAAGLRIKDIDYNISDFYDNSKISKELRGNNFITFSLDLKKINSPQKYKITIGTGAHFYLRGFCEIEDYSQLLPIPPPNYSINPSNNNPLILYPNDEKTLDLQINSDSPTSSTIFLKSKPKESSQIKVTFSPPILYLNPAENGISKVKITTNKTELGTHTIPIIANITFPSEIQFTMNNITKKISNPVGSFIPLNSNFTMTVESVPPLYQPALDFSKNVIEPFAGLITATIIPIATAIAGLIVYLKKKQSSSIEKSKNRNRNQS